MTFPYLESTDVLDNGDVVFEFFKTEAQFKSDKIQTVTLTQNDIEELMGLEFQNGKVAVYNDYYRPETDELVDYETLLDYEDYVLNNSEHIFTQFKRQRL